MKYFLLHVYFPGFITVTHDTGDMLCYDMDLLVVITAIHNLAY